MKYSFLLLFMIVYLSFTIYVHSISANHINNHDEIQFINSFEEDITGDGLREYLKLQGIRLTKESNYYRNIWLEITGPFSQQWKVSLRNGYDPSLIITNITSSQNNDLFFKSAQDEHLKQYNYQLYTIKHNALKQIMLPTLSSFKLTFLNNYKYKIQNPLLDEPITFNMSNKTIHEIKPDFYDNNGILLTDKELTIEPRFTFEPIYISQSKGYGLRSVQYIPDLDNEFNLLQLKTIWYFKNNRWINLQTTSIK